MPKHTPAARISTLAAYLGWTARLEDLANELPFLISKIQEEHVRDAMSRYYGGSRSSQIVDPVTGRPEPSDSRFYQHLKQGREAIKTLLSVEPHEYARLKKIKYNTTG